MIIDFFEMIGEVLQKFSSILSYFDSLKNILESVITDISNYSVVGALEPYLGTIRYVAGDKVYLTMARAIQIGLFLVLVKSLYELVNTIIMQLKAQKPISFIKTFLKL